MDGSHLSPTGEAFYAQRIAEELHADGYLPQTPNVFHGYIPWMRTVPITVRASAGRVDVSWSHQTLSRPGPVAQGRDYCVADVGAVPGGSREDPAARRWGLRDPAADHLVPADRAVGRDVAGMGASVGAAPAPGRVVVTGGSPLVCVAGSEVVRRADPHGAPAPLGHAAHRRAAGAAAHVAVARVQAVSVGGRSVWRRGVR